MSDGRHNFKWLNKQGVESDSGFIVQSVSHGVIEFRRHGHTISISVENGMVDGVVPCVIIEPTAFARWDDDPPYTALPEDEQEKLLSIFTAAMEFQGIQVSVERRFT